MHPMMAFVTQARNAFLWKYTKGTEYECGTPLSLPKSDVPQIVPIVLRVSRACAS